MSIYHQQIYSEEGTLSKIKTILDSNNKKLQKSENIEDNSDKISSRIKKNK